MKKYLLFIIIIFSLIPNRSLFAADIRIVSSRDSVSIGETFTATVYIDSTDKSINNAEGVINFSTDSLSVSSINSAGSIFTLWVEQPSFSNTNGTITFNGGKPNPGYQGRDGKVFEVTMVAKAGGNPKLEFGSVAIRANDGTGENVTESKQSETVAVIGGATPTQATTPSTPDTVVPTPVVPATPTIEVVSLLPAPKITSKEMPDENIWYNLDKATFRWSLPSGTLATQLLLGRRPDSVPTVLYVPPIRERTLEDFTEGVWYLHARLQNEAGWGRTAHRKILIDQTPPSNHTVTINDSPEGHLDLILNAEDALSGIKSFTLTLADGRNFEEAYTGTSTPTKIHMPLLSPGPHIIELLVEDNAGNSATSSHEIIAPEILAPEWKNYPQVVSVGGRFEITGTSHYPQNKVKIWVEENGQKIKEYEIESRIDSGFTFTSDEVVSDGPIAIWAQNVLEGRIESPLGEKIFINAEKKPIWQFLDKMRSNVALLTSLVGVLLLLIIIVNLTMSKVGKMRRRVRKDITETESEMHQVFAILLEDVKRYVDIAERPGVKSKLSITEKMVLKDLTRDIKESEKYFTKKLEQIKKKDL